MNFMNFIKKLKKEKIGLIIIDEFSTITTRQFYILDRRFRQVMEKEEIPFGGIKVILCGDFMQNEAIGGDSLYVNSLLVARYNKNYLYQWRKIELIIPIHQKELCKELQKFLINQTYIS